MDTSITVDYTSITFVSILVYSSSPCLFACSCGKSILNYGNGFFIQVYYEPPMSQCYVTLNLEDMIRQRINKVYK